MDKYIHYGVDVTYQQLVDKSFRDDLKKAGIPYTDLPILENDVLTYEYDGKRRYAVIELGNAPDAYIENVYITTEIPLDMDWEALLRDCHGQRCKEEPMPLKTKARIICEKAYDIALPETTPENVFSAVLPEADPREFKYALISLGYSADDILEMDHHDISDDFIKKYVTGDVK